MKILVAEDDPIQRTVITATLTARGDTVMSVDSGEAAVELVTAGVHHFDAILMDQQMPGIGGAEATRRIRTIGDWRGQTPILAMSAKDLVAGQVIDGFLPKDPAAIDASMARLRETVTESVAAGQQRIISEQQPPRKVLVNWLKLNLALTTALGGLVCGGIGWIIAGTLFYARTDARITAIETGQHAVRLMLGAKSADEPLVDVAKTLSDQRRAQDGWLDEDHKALVDVDRRLNEMRRDSEANLTAARRETDANLTAARRETDANLAKANADVAVLQAQMKFLADRSPSTPLPTGPRR
jgi:CheY-like chemotaxis protein